MGKKVQKLGLFFIPVVLVVLFTSSISSATPMLAGFVKVTNREPQSVVTPMFVVYAAPVPAAGSREDGQIQALPEPVVVELPVTARAYEAQNWFMVTTKGNECYVPGDSLLNVVSTAKTRLVAIVHWSSMQPDHLPLHCGQRVLAENDLCPDGVSPKVPACASGSSIIMEFNGAMDGRGQAIDPVYFVERVRKALDQGSR